MTKKRRMTLELPETTHEQCEALMKRFDFASKTEAIRKAVSVLVELGRKAPVGAIQGEIIHPDGSREAFILVP